MSSFAAEQSVFPFVHAVTNAAVYIATRDIRTALLFMFLWEPIEFVVGSMGFTGLVETCADSILGDPITGLLAILAFWVFDRATHFDEVFVKHASPASRLLVFVAIGLATALPPQFATATLYTGIMYFTLVYIAIACIGYHKLLFRTTNDPEVIYARQSVIVWLIAVVIYAIISVVITDGGMATSSWMRVLYVSLAFNLLALAIAFPK